MIRTENINKSFGDLQVLKGIDLEIGSAEIISIVGASGACGQVFVRRIIARWVKCDFYFNPLHRFSLIVLNFSLGGLK